MCEIVPSALGMLGSSTMLVPRRLLARYLLNNRDRQAERLNAQIRAFEPVTKEGAMVSAREVAARYAAYEWYREARKAAPPAEAAEFARQNWMVFLPIVNEGWGRLLLRIATGRRRSKRRRRAAATPMLVPA